MWRGAAFSETCLLHHAKFYKTGRNSFDNHHFQRNKKKIDNNAETPSEPLECCGKTICSSFTSSNFQPTCIFCGSNDGYPRNASSFVIDRRVRQAAVLLGDDKLVAKLSQGDMPAIEFEYHPSCLCKLYSWAAYLQKSGSNINGHAVTYEIVLSETIGFIIKELK